MLKKLFFILIIHIGFLTSTHAQTQQKINFFVKKFSIRGESPLSPQEISALFTPYQHQHYDLEQLQEVAKILEQAIRRQGYSFYRVILPPQTLMSESIHFQVISFALNKINLQGHQYFNEQNILASLPTLILGQSPNTKTLTQALKVTNQHPFKHLTLTFKQSTEIADKIDAKITVNEQRPFQAFIMMNNTGTKKTGDFRLTASIQHGNVWDLDHQISASYTTSPTHFKTVKQYGINYSLPIYPFGGWLRAYYAFSDVDNGIIANDFSVTGSGEMYGLHYQQFLPHFGRYHHWLDVGIDHHFFINDVKFQETPIGHSVRAVPYSLLYHGKYPFEHAKVDFQLQWLGNTGLGEHNNRESYQNSRVNARKNWSLFRYGGHLNTHFKQWKFKLSLTGQYSDQAIISGEQLGIGGSYSIRGYAERETSADSGEILKLELSTPTWNGTHLLGFYDYGQGRQQHVLANEVKDWQLSSIGVGLRWQWKTYLFTQIDFAHALDESPLVTGTHSGTNRIHANVVLRF